MGQNCLPTVTIAICTFNEAKNIGKFLESVLSQREEGYRFANIWICNDGSTDGTVNKIKTLHSKKITIFDNNRRIGKSSRLNEIYARLKSDILIQSDADVVFDHPYVIHDLIQPFLQDKTVGMCGGNPNPCTGKTFTEKAINCTVNAYLPLRRTLRGGNNPFSCDGRLLAYKKELVKKIFIPVDMTSNDRFTYYCCLALGYRFRYVESAIVRFRSPTNLKDQVKQNGRFVSCPIRMSKYFPQDLIKKEEYIPFSLKGKLFFSMFLRHPFLCTYIFWVNTYCRLNAKRYERTISSLWPMAMSTKTLS